jgi:site-specific DNA recombinase
LDRQDGAGVDRQLADCHELARSRGWDVVEYVDNDISAFQRKRRPAYEQLLADVQAGAIDAVVAYHPDRLYRRLTDLERIIELVEKTKVKVLTANAGEFDLNTASGRMTARVVASVAQHESERIGERVSRAKKSLAAQGKASGGGRRPFGLSSDWTKLNAKEAKEIRRVVDNIRAGATWLSEVNRLNAAGVLTTAGREWSVGNLKRCLTSPHIAGLRSYHGEIVGPAAWPAIVSREVWDDLCLEAATRKRGRPRLDRHFLTSLLVCGKCGFRLYANSRKSNGFEYRCPTTPTTRGRGCGGVSIAADRLEQHVNATVTEWLADDEFIAALDRHLTYGGQQDAVLLEELEEIERKMTRLTEQWAAGERSDADYDAGHRVLKERQAEKRALLSGAPRVRSSVTARELRDAWEGLTVPERRRALPSLMVTPIVVGPATGGRPEDRVELLEVWATAEAA